MGSTQQGQERLLQENKSVDKSLSWSGWWKGAATFLARSAFRKTPSLYGTQSDQLSCDCDGSRAMIATLGDAGVRRQKVVLQSLGVFF